MSRLELEDVPYVQDRRNNRAEQVGSSYSPLSPSTPATSYLQSSSSGGGDQACVEDLGRVSEPSTPMETRSSAARKLSRKSPRKSSRREDEDNDSSTREEEGESVEPPVHAISKRRTRSTSATTDASPYPTEGRVQRYRDIPSRRNSRK